MSTICNAGGMCYENTINYKGKGIINEIMRLAKVYIDMADLYNAVVANNKFDYCKELIFEKLLIEVDRFLTKCRNSAIQKQDIDIEEFDFFIKEHFNKVKDYMTNEVRISNNITDIFNMLHSALLDCYKNNFKQFISEERSTHEIVDYLINTLTKYLEFSAFELGGILVNNGSACAHRKGATGHECECRVGGLVIYVADQFIVSNYVLKLADTFIEKKDSYVKDLLVVLDFKFRKDVLINGDFINSVKKLASVVNHLYISNIEKENISEDILDYIDSNNKVTYLGTDNKNYKMLLKNKP